MRSHSMLFFCWFICCHLKVGERAPLQHPWITHCAQVHCPCTCTSSWILGFGEINPCYILCHGRTFPNAFFNPINVFGKAFCQKRLPVLLLLGGRIRDRVHNAMPNISVQHQSLNIWNIMSSVSCYTVNIVHRSTMRMRWTNIEIVIGAEIEEGTKAKRQRQSQDRWQRQRQSRGRTVNDIDSDCRFARHRMTAT